MKLRFFVFYKTSLLWNLYEAVHLYLAVTQTASLTEKSSNNDGQHDILLCHRCWAEELRQ